MNMCYDGALVMPSSYAVMSEEEMAYVEGGNLNTLKNNLKGIYWIVRDYMCRWRSSATVGSALSSMGLSLGQIASMAGSYWTLAGKVMTIVSAVTSWMGAHAWVIASVGAAVGFTVFMECKKYF